MSQLLPDRTDTRRERQRGRVAAVGALVVALGILLVVASLVADDPMGVAFAFVWVFTATFFGWFLIARRGYLRFLALPAIVLALALLFTFAYDHKVVLPVLIGVLVLFGLFARYAVHHADASMHAARRHAHPAAPATNGVLIINPRSGDGKAERFQLREEALRRRIEPLLLSPGDDLSNVAERAVRAGADVIGMAGGDGSQALVATVAMRHDVAHVCVPAGTRNHFALDLGLDRNDVVGALDAFTDGIERRIDLASLNEQVFVNNASLGVYAQVVQADAYRGSKLGTWRQMLPDMVGRNAGSDLQFDSPDAKSWNDVAFVIVSNNPYQMRRFRGVGSRPRLDSGHLGVFAARIHRARSVAKLVTLGTVGAHRRLGGVLQWSCPEFEVRSGAPIAVGLDGESFMLNPPLRFVSLPGALRVRLPRHAKGISPAAAAVPLTRRNLRLLVRIASGRAENAPPAPAPNNARTPGDPLR